MKAKWKNVFLIWNDYLQFFSCFYDSMIFRLIFPNIRDLKENLWEYLKTRFWLIFKIFHQQCLKFYNKELHGFANFLWSYFKVYHSFLQKSCSNDNKVLYRRCFEHFFSFKEYNKAGGIYDMRIQKSLVINQNFVIIPEWKLLNDGKYVFTP